MTNLIAAYQRNEILEFEKILKVQRFDTHKLVYAQIILYNSQVLKIICHRVIEEPSWTIPSSEIISKIF